MKTSFLPKSNAIILKISALTGNFDFYWPLQEVDKEFKQQSFYCPPEFSSIQFFIRIYQRLGSKSHVCFDAPVLKWMNELLKRSTFKKYLEISTRIRKKMPLQGRRNSPPPTVCWNRVLHGHFLGIKMQHWNKCLSSVFVSFWSTLLTPSQRDAWKKLKLPKVGKTCLELSFF